MEGARIFRRRKSQLGTSRMTVRAEILRRILPIPEAIVIEADEYIFTLAAALSEVSILGEALTFYRIHAGNLFQVTGFQKGPISPETEEPHASGFRAVRKAPPARTEGCRRECCH